MSRRPASGWLHRRVSGIMREILPSATLGLEQSLRKLAIVLDV